MSDSDHADERGEDDSPGPAPRVSRMALTALLLNIPCFCVPITLAAALFGVISWIRIRRRPDLRGGAASIAAVVLGVGLSALFLPYWMHMMRLATHGPEDALTAAFAGDSAALRHEFAGPGAAVTDADVATLAAQLRDRYGGFQGAQVVRVSDPPRSSSGGWEIPFVLSFERASVPCVATIIMQDPKTKAPLLRLATIRITDEKRGDIIFPAEIQPQGAP